jgi:hypothetical protein
VASSNVSICVGQSANLNANPSGGTAPYTYAWSSGETTSTINPSPIITSSYTVTVTDNAGCTSSPSVSTVTVSAPLSVSVNSDSICPGSTTTLNAIAFGGDGSYTYNWMPSNQTGSSVMVSPTVNTTYTVSLSDGCTVTNATATAVLVVKTNPVVSFAPDSLEGCTPTCITFVNTTSIAPSTIVSQSWNFGDGTNSTLASPVHCYNLAGNYNPTLSLTLSNGCVSSFTTGSLISIYQQPNASFAADNYNPTLAESQVLLTNSSQNYNTVEWLYNGQTSSNNSLEKKYESPKIYIKGSRSLTNCSHREIAADTPATSSICCKLPICTRSTSMFGTPIASAKRWERRT